MPDHLHPHQIFTESFTLLREVDAAKGAEQKLDKLAYALRSMAWGLRELTNYVGLELGTIHMLVERNFRMLEERNQRRP